MEEWRQLAQVVKPDMKPKSPRQHKPNISKTPGSKYDNKVQPAQCICKKYTSVKHISDFTFQNHIAQ